MLLYDVGHQTQSGPSAHVSCFTVLYHLSYCKWHVILLDLDYRNYYVCDPAFLRLELTFTRCYVNGCCACWLMVVVGRMTMMCSKVNMFLLSKYHI